MSDMKGNPHYTEALTNATQLAEHAASQATLALAYEQRTANLIALMNTNHENGGRYFRTRIEPAAAEIVARLGLEGAR